MADEWATDPVFKMRSRFTQEQHDGRPTLVVETWLQPGGGVTPHVHPAMEERFTVHEGEAQFLSGRRWTTCGPGETAVVPPGTRHAFRNRSDAPARFVCHATPPSTLQEFLEDAAALSRAGALTRHGLPTSLDALLQAAVLADRHREMVQLGAPLPPAPIQRALFPPLARLGRRRGYQPGALGAR